MRHVEKISFKTNWLMIGHGVLLLMVLPLAYAESSTLPQQIATNTAASSKQNLAILKDKVTDFLMVQAVGYPGKVSVKTGAIDPNLKLAACHDVNVFMPNGSRPWGKTSVGVSCMAPQWSIYVQATVSVQAQYLVAAIPLVQGQQVTQQDMLFESGDLTQLPAGIFTDMPQAIGRTVNISMRAGTVLRQDMLKASPVVQQGQTVMVVSNGQGFSVSAEGQAMTKASEGQVVQVKVANGQLVSGIARIGGKVEVIY
ncbi:MAG: flagella basal body P-ring formation protein FlgA [Methylophilaceae bacterium 17-44-8]|jgi:flagella basal body P-ring formation protein FlgA|nr:MAG: flagella basal body P-ring formation protein FlgA [Methylophilales bacterium 28-44-11]OYZ08765.1 MAG: flagella basal body P-ring formation protein FlgA [Methylophilales bacterium 16-45-7]OZA05447.1 MAG: flagella basal body P-ring formation protein FlgA [Methylophilaceae bacterium 17-44-8]